MRLLWAMWLGLLGFGFTQTSVERVFRGNITLENQVLPIRMYLKLNGPKVTGYYLYEGRNGRLRLEGTFSEAELNLKEFDGNKQTGVFRGGYNDRGIEGDWYTPNGKRGGRFSMVEQDYRFRQARLETVRVAEAKPQIQVLYPAFSGPSSGWQSINRQTAQSVGSILSLYRQDYQTALKEKRLSEMRCLDMNYTLTLGTDGLVSFFIVGSSCGPSGCAYPGSWIRGYTFDPQTGKQVPLSALFKPSSGYLERLVALGRKQVLENLQADPSDRPWLDLNAEDLQWTLSAKGLTLYFSVPHALGDYREAFIGYDQLRDIWATTGPAARVR
ncbi:RsiV family protein [Meiothermus sp.]|uniref:RsiV family protein n=1 Tax=Meiothermus sp. TaxID=1955249 RepID=UPI00307F0B04